METLYSVLIGASAPSILCFIVAFLTWDKLKKDAEERTDLKKKLDTLEREKLGQIERDFRTLNTRFENHQREDRTGEFCSRLNGLADAVSAYAAKVDRALETNAAQSAKIENMLLFLGNLREDLQRHVAGCSGTTGKPSKR